MQHWIKSDYSKQIVLNVTPASAGWKSLDFRVVQLKKGEHYSEATGGNEIALVPLAGAGVLKAAGLTAEVKRAGVFAEMPHVLYVPPGQTLTVDATADFEFAVGGAPARGKYPVRLFAPGEMRAEVRGGGTATRQVHHILAAPLPAERLILYEVYVPGGAWSGWPPHCHDGYLDSPRLEETYYFRIQPENGFGIHRNYRVDIDFDETFPVADKDLVLVTQGFHSSAATPGHNMYFLNYLAGDLYDEERARGPVDDPRYGWMRQDWVGKTLQLPILGAKK